jgi:beta-glucanase (GH16 family)
MKRVLFYTIILFSLATCKSDDGDVTPSITEYEGYTLVWSEEFNEPSISNLNWTYELGDGTAYGLSPGWGNAEKQLYTNAAANAFIEKDADEVSALVISANKETDGSYSSAKLTTQGLHSFRYGRIEARIKLPVGQGMWPAFWMLGNNITDVDWPGCGEIDIMELVGFEPNTIHGTLHYTNFEKKYNSTQGSKVLSSGNFDEAYHDFRIDWTPASIVFSLDGTPYNTIAIEEDMKEFQRSFYLILNVAVGGNWPGDPDNSTVFPKRMYVDYIRAYSKDDFTAPAEPTLNIDEETIGTITPPSIAQHAFSNTLGQFPGIGLKSYGAGGEPVISSSPIAVEGDSAILFSYPGGNWGGGWFEMETPLDLSAFASGNLIFSIQNPAILADAELKLEALSNSAAVFLINYTPVPLANNYVQYTIPLADFTGLDFSAIKIPFSLWNPKDANGEYPVVDILLDNIYWE